MVKMADFILYIFYIYVYVTTIKTKKICIGMTKEVVSADALQPKTSRDSLIRKSRSVSSLQPEMEHIMGTAGSSVREPGKDFRTGLVFGDLGKEFEQVELCSGLGDARSKDNSVTRYLNPFCLEGERSREGPSGN